MDSGAIGPNGRNVFRILNVELEKRKNSELAQIQVRLMENNVEAQNLKPTDA